MATLYAQMFLATKEEVKIAEAQNKEKRALASVDSAIINNETDQLSQQSRLEELTRTWVENPRGAELEAVLNQEVYIERLVKTHTALVAFRARMFETPTK